MLLQTLLIVTIAGPTENLSLPPRPSTATQGSEFAQSIRRLPLQEREERIVREVLRGNVPDFLRLLVPITVKAGGHRATYKVTADYLAIGSDTDMFYTPITPTTAQRIADQLDCVLPTTKIVDDVHNAADWTPEPLPIPPTPAMTTVPVFLQHNRMLLDQRAGQPQRKLVAGTKKDIVITNRLLDRPGRVAIYGWHYPNGKPIQPLYTGHIASYVDYSHGVRFVRRRMIVDNEPMTIENVLADPELAPLLSTEGVMKSKYYNQ